MLPSLQPPKRKPPPRKLTLNIQTTNETILQSKQISVIAAASLNQPNHHVNNNLSNAIQTDANTSITELDFTAPTGIIFDNFSVKEDPSDSIGMSAQDWYSAYCNKDIEEIREIGEGSGGMVRLCRFRPVDKHKSYYKFASSSGPFALKEIPANPDPELRKQILRELQFNRSCRSPFIVNYYGAFLVEEIGQIYIAMEYCDGGSLKEILKLVSAKNARISEKVLACIATSVLEGITYLYSQKIIHRDIKPQNILLTSKGEVKLCDFGVSGEVVDSLVTTFTGTSYYMAPERIMGQPYTVTSDVWSLGLTLMELAMNKFPFDATVSLTPIELLSQIVNSPSPTLPDEPNVKWSASFHHFLSCCLEKDSIKRPSPKKLLSHPWIKGHRSKNFDMENFIREAWA